MDFSSQHDIITIKNITGKDFSFSYAKSEGGRTYVIPADKTMMFPRFLASHAVKHMIDAILIAGGERPNNELRRVELAEQIIVHEENYNQPGKPSEVELLNERVAQLNKPSDLDNILKGRNKALGIQPNMAPAPVVPEPAIVPTPVPTPSAPVETPKADEKFAGLKAQAKLHEAVDKQAKTAKDTAKQPLTKEILRSFAINKLGLHVDEDPKLVKAFETLPVDQLAQQLQYSEQED